MLNQGIHDFSGTFVTKKYNSVQNVKSQMHIFANTVKRDPIGEKFTDANISDLQVKF